MDNSDYRIFMIMLMDLIENKLLTSAEAEAAREYYLKARRKKQPGADPEG